MSGGSSLHLDRSGDPRVARLFLNRPDIRNAFDDRMIAEMTENVEALGGDPSVRVVVLGGHGKAFCAGADLNWMRKMASYSLEENIRDSSALAAMFRALDSIPKPLIGRVHGAALGGGTGLAAVCDMVVAAEGTLFGTTEVRLGLVPAVISPYVLRKIGEANARVWFLTGERVEAREAMRAGLVHVVVPEASLDEAVGKLVTACLQGGPEALSEAKRLATAGFQPVDERIRQTVASIAQRRVSDEGQEGMNAFLSRRPPGWVRP